MKHLLLLLFSITSILLMGQNIESFTYEVSKQNASSPSLLPVDHTVDPAGNIYVLMMHSEENGVNTGMAISKYHPQHGLQWNKLIASEYRSVSPKQISWSKLDELLILGEHTHNSGGPRTYFARMSSHGQILLEKVYNKNVEGGALRGVKMDELATGDIVLQVFDFSENGSHGFIRIDYQGQIQNRVFLPQGFVLQDFHITQNNEIFALAIDVQDFTKCFIYKFDYNMHLQTSREFKPTHDASIHPIQLSENAAGQAVVWLHFNDGSGIHHAAFDLYNNGPFTTYSLLQQEDILLSDHKSNTGSVIVAGRNSSGARFYQHDNQGMVSQVLLETSALINQGRLLQSYEISADNRIIALLSDDTGHKVDTFVVASSKMDFKAGCDLVDQHFEYHMERSIRSEPIDMDLILLPIIGTTPETSKEEIDIIWTEKCRSNCPEEPPTPSLSLSPLTNWRYSFEASGQLDPSITGFYWSVNGQVVGTGPAWEHIFDAPGQHRVCLTITTACGSKTICRNVHIPASRRLNPEPKARVQAWPNPVVDQLHIDIQKGNTETVQIFNHLGQQIELPWMQESDVRIRVQTSSLPSGQYFLKLVDPNGLSETLKFIK